MRVLQTSTKADFVCRSSGRTSVVACCRRVRGLRRQLAVERTSRTSSERSSWNCRSRRPGLRSTVFRSTRPTTMTSSPTQPIRGRHSPAGAHPGNDNKIVESSLATGRVAGRNVLQRQLRCCLSWHSTDNDTDTDILADFRAMIVARMSACPATSLFSLPQE